MSLTKRWALPHSKLCLSVAWRIHEACRCSSTTSSTTFTAWQRTARSVKDTDVTNEYLEQIRETHDPSLHLKTLEEEVRGTMGKALGKQGAKITKALTKMMEERRYYDGLVQQQQQQHDPSSLELEKCIQRHNQYRQEAITARWELMVHRQAVGFIVNNHTVVTEAFPIGDALPPPSLKLEEEGKSSNETLHKNQERTNTNTKQKFGDQLEWWQGVGRWR